MPLQNKKTPEWLTTGQESRGTTKSRIQLLFKKMKNKEEQKRLKSKGCRDAAMGASKTDPESDNKSLHSTIFPHIPEATGCLLKKIQKTVLLFDIL